MRRMGLLAALLLFLAATPAAAATPSVIAAPIAVAHTTDGAVSYRSIGNDPPLLLIMGYSGSMDTWEPTFVDALARRHRVVIFDNAGIGQTTMPSGTLTMDTMADQTAALISALHLARPDVLGWSMGGMIAQALAARHPRLVHRMVLAATLTGTGKAVLPSSAAVSALSHPTAANVAKLLAIIFPPDQKAAANAYIKSITTFPNLYLAPQATDTLQLKALANWSSGKDPSGHARLHTKTLVADGATDLLIPKANDHQLQHNIAGSQLVLYPDASHAFLFQDEASFVSRVLHFLK